MGDLINEPPKLSENRSHPKLSGYEFFRQDRNYSKYENSKHNSESQKKIESAGTSNKEKMQDKTDKDMDETLLCNSSNNIVREPVTK